MVAVNNSLHKVVVIIGVTSYNKFSKLLLLRERPARWNHWKQSPCGDWWDVTRAFASVASTNQHQAQDVGIPATIRLGFGGYYHSNSRDTWSVGSDVLSVNGVGGLIDELRNVGQTPAETEKSFFITVTITMTKPRKLPQSTE